MHNVWLKIFDGLLNFSAYRTVKRITQKLADTLYSSLIPASEGLYVVRHRKRFYLFIENRVLTPDMLIEIVYDENTHRSLGFYKDSISPFYPYLRLSFFSYVPGISARKGFSGLFRESRFPTDATTFVRPYSVHLVVVR